jgi:hypothetical protein
MNNSIPDEKIKCHRTGFTRSCKEIVCNGECRLWMQITGANPQTGETINQWGCADEWIPLLLIENSQQQRQTGAAVESFRNEMVKRNDLMLGLENGEIIALQGPPRKNNV